MVVDRRRVVVVLHLAAFFFEIAASSGRHVPTADEDRVFSDVTATEFSLRTRVVCYASSQCFLLLASYGYSARCSAVLLFLTFHNLTPYFEVYLLSQSFI